MDNLYLDRNFAPVRAELTATELEITGAVPDWLDGRYLRNGPNAVTDPDPATYHWFTGDGMIHGVRLRDGRAEWYRNRYVRSSRVAAVLGEPRRGENKVHGFDYAANTNVIGHAGRTLAIIEGGSLPYELTDDLDTVGPCDFDGTLRGGYTAHPHRDPATGELHAIAYYFGWGDKVEYSVTGVDGRVRHSVMIDVGGSPMMHDFSLTEKHVVLYDLPVTLDRARAAEGLPSWLRAPAAAIFRRLPARPLPEPLSKAVGRLVLRSPYSTASLPYVWNPDRPARVGVLPRDGRSGDVRWFEVEQCFVFHPLNAYEDGDTIVLDVVRHPKMFASELRGPNEGPPTLDRWTLDLTSGKVREDRFDDHGQEFPRIDERLTGRRHRYGYSAGFDGGEAADLLLKHDLVAGTTSSRAFGAGMGVGEFVFAPSAPDSAEDDGVLMGYVYDAASDTSDLVLVDAGSLEDVARVHLPARVPHGFHGNWLPS